MLHKRITQILVFLLAGWPLLVPPGTCVCQVVRAGECSPDSCTPACADEHSHRASHSITQRGKAHCGCCDDQEAPTRGQYPPGCPANKKVDHSRVFEQYYPPTAAAVAITPQPLCLDLVDGRTLQGLRCVSPHAASPIYLTLCTLLV